jgi:hypothetical protein
MARRATVAGLDGLGKLAGGVWGLPEGNGRRVQQPESIRFPALGRDQFGDRHALPSVSLSPSISRTGK